METESVAEEEGGPRLRLAEPVAASVQKYARITGIVFLVAFLGGLFGEYYAPSQIIVAGNAIATAHNLVSSELVFRLGFLGYLIEAVTDVVLTFLLYVLLRPVHANLALLAVLFRIMATATFAFAEVFYFAPSLILLGGGGGYLSNAFSSDQLNALALLSLNMYMAVGNLFLQFYGVASILLGYLIMRSGYLPRVMGAIWVVAGLGFVTTNVTYVLAPAYASAFLLVPQLIATVSLGLWLLLRGVNVERWNKRGAVVAYSPQAFSRQSPSSPGSE